MLGLGRSLLFDLFLCIVLGLSTEPRAHAANFISNDQSISIEEHCSKESSGGMPIVVFLHGSGGPKSPNLPYRILVKDLSKHGYCIGLPHFLDATHGSAMDPKSHYEIWIQAVKDAVTSLDRHYPSGSKPEVILIGYSLGASVVLAAAATGNRRFKAAVAFSGSLPDRYVSRVTTFPPALIIHGEEDTVIPITNAKQLLELCRRIGSSCEPDFLAGEGHVFSAQAKDSATLRIEAFLRQWAAPNR